MKITMKMKLMVAIAMLATGSSVFAQSQATEVSALIKCHEGKFDAMNAVSQLTSEISGERGAVYGWSGIGAYPDHHTEGKLVFVKSPYLVSSPTFITVGETSWVCVTIQKQ